jgi:2-polyprenyl-6-methoxyphenol hydroxylase-like FAD-dependent oxidoreductase
VARPDLYNVLLRQIPKERIHLGKKVMSTLQNEQGVMIRCADDSTAHIHGDILVGADGAYSAVRQNLYRDLKAKKALPGSDDVPLPYSCVCLVGQTEVLDPEEFPDLKKACSQSYSILGSSRPINVSASHIQCLAHSTL